MFAEFIFNEFQWLTDFIMNVTYPFAEMVPNKATEPAKMIIHEVT